MKFIKWLIIIVVSVGALLVGVVFLLERQLQTAEFKDMVRSAAKEAAGVDVKIADMNVSLFSGLQLKGIVIANPPSYPGDFLTAEEFALRYRLLPLLQKRVEVDDLSTRKPVLTLARNENREWNYEKLGGAKPAGGKSAGPAPAAGVPALDVALSSLAMKSGEVNILSEKGKALARLQNMNLASALGLTGEKVSGSGQSSIQTFSIGDLLFVRNVVAPVSISREAIKLAPMKGAIAAGTVTGDLGLQLAGGFKYLLNLDAQNADVSVLLQEAGTKQTMKGKLRAVASVEGTGGLATIVGNGKLEITAGSLAQMPLQGLLATVLQVSELREIQFSECLVEFKLAKNVMQTPVVKLTSPAVQVSGKGEVSFTDNTLNHDLTLALAKNLLNNVPKELASAFKDRGDGFLAVDFHVSGPYDAPKTDLAQGLIKGAIQNQLQQQMKKLFR